MVMFYSDLFAFFTAVAEVFSNKRGSKFDLLYNIKLGSSDNL